MSSYKTSTGEYLTKDEIDKEVQKTKELYTQMVAERLHIDPNNIFCERCKLSNRVATGVSRSHIMSVDYCQRIGAAELAYDIMNLEHLCLSCHREIESHSNEYRKAWYLLRLKYILEFNELPNYNYFKENEK